MAKRIENSQLLAKIESTYGVDPSPTPGADAIRMIECNFTVNTEVNANPEKNGSLDAASPDVSITTATISGSARVKGSGTEGTPPELGTLFRGCALGETIVASTSVTYAPISDNLESLTFYYNEDGILRIMTGAYGNVSFDFVARQKWIANFTFTGLFVSKADVALSAGTYQSTAAVNWTNGTATIDATAAAIQQFTLDNGVPIVSLDDPNALYGIAETLQTSRDIRGNINPLEVAVATRDLFGKIQPNTTVALVAATGATGGNIATMTVPNALLLGEEPQDDQGARRQGYPYAATGIDSGFSLAFT